jgi:hypothetical protein
MGFVSTSGGVGRFRPFTAALFAFSLVVVLVTGASAQQQTGRMTGSIVDPSSAVIPGAIVRATDLGTARDYTAVTDSHGEFVINNLPFGFYKVTVGAKGFASGIVPRVQVDVSQNAEVKLTLNVASAGTEVVVTGEQAVVQTETTEIANTIDRKQILELPLPTRNPLDLINGMAGMAKPSSGSDSYVHGLRGNATNLTQDGINVADNFVKTSAFFAISAPTVDTVGEFTVSVAGSSTNAGFGAAQVNMATARGTNSLHGSVFWFQRTSFLNANTYFNAAQGLPTPFQLQNRIGLNVGGPVFAPKVYNGKNKTWFFLAFEAFREPVARSRSRLVLSDAARTGSLTYNRVDNGQPQTINFFNGNYGSKTLDTAVMNYYNGLVPSANQTSAVSGCSGTDSYNLRCFTWNVPGRGFQNRYTARIDHQLTNNHAIEFVYNQANYLTANDFLNSIEQYFPKSPGGGQESKRQVLTWAFHSTFGTNKTNSVRFGFQRAPVTFTIKDNFAATSGLQLTFPTVQDPSITSTNLPQGRNTPVRQLTDNFGWVRGHHNLQFNGEWRWILADNFFFNTIPQRIVLGSNSANPDGLIQTNATMFPGGISSPDFGNAQAVYRIVTGLLGSTNVGFNHTSPTSGYIPGIPRFYNPTQTNLAFSVQDSYRFRPNLTLQYGVRWEYQGPFDSRNGLILQPDDRLGAIFGPAGANNQLNVLSTPVVTDVTLHLAGGKNGHDLYNKQYTNIAPLVGVSWDPFGDGKTAVRAGFAMHFTQDGFTLFSVGATGNNGLFSVVTNSTPTGVFNPSAPPTITTPTDLLPNISQKANFAASNTANLWSFKQNLAVPYVEEWNLAIQREIGARFTLEARYIGNHGVKLYRATDYDEINLLNNPYTAGGVTVPNLLTEFNHAVTNLQMCRATTPTCANFSYQGLPGQFQLPVLSTLFTGISAGSGFANSGFITNLTPSSGLNPGAMFDTLRRSPTYAANRANFPLNYFVPNPWANNSIYVDNSSWSNYNGLEVELRRRFSSGLYFVANYTFSKVLTDQKFLQSQQEFQDYVSLANRPLDKNRAGFDITHNVSATFLYPLPIGRGQKFLGGANAWLNGIIGGWNLQGITRWASGAPFNLLTNRFPTGQTSYSADTPVLRNMTISQFAQNVGVYKTPTGVYWLNPNSGLFTISGTSSKPVICTATTTSPCFDYAAPGSLGNTPWNGFNGPSQFNQDLSIRKQTFIPAISEQFNFEIRLEAFNVFNHANFVNPGVGTTTNPGPANLQSTQFGQLTTVSDTVRGGGVNSRIVQWAIRVNF